MIRLDPRTTAMVCIDLHRGHLDPRVATLPLPPEQCRRVIASTRELLEKLRGAGVPVIHVLTEYRESAEIAANPFWAAVHDDPTKARRGILRHNLAGSPGTEPIPELLGPGDRLVRTKKRYSAFYATDLDFLLRSLGARAVILAGVNTNSCIQCAAFEACNRDYLVVVAAECVDTMDGDDLHRFALENIRRALGWVLTNEGILAALVA